MSRIAHLYVRSYDRLLCAEEHKFIIFLLLIFIIPRIIWAVIVPVEPLSDSYAYDTFARNIVDYGVFGWRPDQPTAYWPVGTSAIVAFVYTVFGQKYEFIVIMNIIFSFANLILIYRISRMYFGQTAGRCAGLLFAIWPGLIMYTTIIASELVFMFFCLMVLWVWESRMMPAWPRLFLIGLLVAAASYVRPLALLIPIVLVAVDLVRINLSVRQAVISIVVPFIVMAVCIAPWTYRNYTVFGEPEIISTNLGPTLWMGNNPETNGGYQRLPDWAKGVSETERARRLQNAAIAYILDDPAAFIWRTLVKFVRLHERETIPVVWNEVGIEDSLSRFAIMPLKIVSTSYWLGVLIFACIGIGIIIRRDGIVGGLAHPAFVLWLYFSGVHAVIIMGDRYHMPSSPFIAMLAGVAVASLAEWLVLRSRERLNSALVGRRTAS